MRVLNISVQIVLFSLLFSSCIEENYREDFRTLPEPPHADFVEAYDLWYVDYHQTVGADEIPFMQLAFTFSFINGKMYANNNISGIGHHGNGFGIRIGDYSWRSNVLSSHHDIDGRYDFEIIPSLTVENEIEMYNAYTDTSYFLIGYNVDEFDYDKLFYENVEYLLQDFEIWNKYYTSSSGLLNEFDYENYLSFTSEKNNTFYSSKSELGTNIDFVNWSYEGAYTVEDIIGFEDLKFLTLFYDRVMKEEFELSVSDTIIELFHLASQTTYKFEGDYFIEYLKDGSSKKKKRSSRKRTIIKRNKVHKISY